MAEHSGEDPSVDAEGLSVSSRFLHNILKEVVREEL